MTDATIETRPTTCAVFIHPLPGEDSSQSVAIDVTPRPKRLKRRTAAIIAPASYEVNGESQFLTVVRQPHRTGVSRPRPSSTLGAYRPATRRSVGDRDRTRDPVRKSPAPSPALPVATRSPLRRARSSGHHHRRIKAQAAGLAPRYIYATIGYRLTISCERCSTVTSLPPVTHKNQRLARATNIGNAREEHSHLGAP